MVEIRQQLARNVIKQLFALVEVDRWLRQWAEIIHHLLAQGAGSRSAEPAELPLGLAVGIVGHEARVNIVVMLVNKPGVEARELLVGRNANLILADKSVECVLYILNEDMVIFLGRTDKVPVLCERLV